MIPKIIHYCWFGQDPLPPLAEKCLQSWARFLPDYKLKRWDETNFNVSMNTYASEAASCNQWAFVSDYVRLWALFHEGGVYMDTDVEVLQNLDRFLDCSAFSGFESIHQVPTGIIGAVAGNDWIKLLLDAYKDRSFLLPDGEMDIQTNVEFITERSLPLGLVPDNSYQVLAYDTHIFPKEYFCPLSVGSKRTDFTENTHTIHHFAGSWLPKGKRCKIGFRKALSHLPLAERVYLEARDALKNTLKMANKP